MFSIFDPLSMSDLFWSKYGKQNLKSIIHYIYIFHTV